MRKLFYKILRWFEKQRLKKLGLQILTATSGYPEQLPYENLNRAGRRQINNRE